MAPFGSASFSKPAQNVAPAGHAMSGPGCVTGGRVTGGVTGGGGTGGVVTGGEVTGGGVAAGRERGAVRAVLLAAVARGRRCRAIRAGGARSVAAGGRGRAGAGLALLGRAGSVRRGPAVLGVVGVVIVDGHGAGRGAT